MITVGLRRVLIIFMSVLFQVAFVFFLFAAFPAFRNTFILIFTVLAVFVMLVIISIDISPDYKLTWIFVLAISPVLGTLVFLLSKRQKFKKHRINMTKNSEIIDSIDSDCHAIENYDSAILKQAHYLKNYADAKFFSNNCTTYYKVGEQMWRDLLLELDKAETFIFMEYFIVEDGEMLGSILDILKKKAAAGVEVRFIFDSFGSLFKAPNNFAKNLARDGIKCIPFNRKIRLFDIGINNRDHRKLTVIDGKVAFTGGVNLADEYINKNSKFGHWKDTAIRIKGHSANYFTIMFLTLWGICEDRIPDYDHFIIKSDDKTAQSAKGLVVPYTDYPGDDESVGEIMYEQMVSNASDYVYITSPYLILDYNMINELVIAAKSGIDVRIIVPGIPDKKIVYVLTKSFYKPLLKAGVRIFEYTPGFIHSKQFVSDDKTAIIGTINLDYRSLTHHIENAVWLVEDKAVIEIKEDFFDVQKQCREVQLGDIRNSKIVDLLMLPILRAFAPLF